MARTKLLHRVFETQNSPHAQVLRTNLLTKLKNTFVYFGGNKNYFKDTVLLIKWLFDRIFLSLPYDQPINSSQPKPFEKKGTTGLLMTMLVWLPILSIVSVLFLVPSVVSGLLKRYAKLLSHQNESRTWQIWMFAMGHTIQTFIDIILIVICAPVTFLVMPVISLLALLATVLVSPIVLAVELMSLSRALKWRALFFKLPFKRHGNDLGDQVELNENPDANLLGLTHQQLLTQIWSRREEPMHVNQVDVDLDGEASDYFAFYYVGKDPSQDAPDFILTASDIAENMAAFRAMLHLNMFDFLAENESPSWPYLSQKDKDENPSQVGDPQGQRRNYLLKWLSDRGVDVDLNEQINLDRELAR